MSQIDISQWKEFKLTELFNVKTGAYLSKNQLQPGSIPRVTVLSVNNGIVGSFERCGLSNERLFSNFLSVNFFGNVFYHDSLCSVDMKVHVLEPKHLYSKESMLFLVAVLRRKFVIEGYGTYGNQLSSSKLKMDMVYLPVDKNGDPDWQYMDTCIAKLTALAHKNVSALKEAKAKPAKLNIDHWGEFKISDWFDIRPSKYTKENGKALKNAELFDGGNNPVIVNSNTNNGIGGYTSKPLTEQGNVITYSDTTDGANTIFYQAKPFVGYSHVKVMLPKLKLSAATMIYLTSIIISAIKNQKYDFSYKLTTDKMLNTIIKLPIDAKGKPDWEYMSNQVRHLATLSDLTITSLRSVI